MKASLDPLVSGRLAKLCGMFGSAHVGERAAAAAKADELVRSLGLTWGDVFDGKGNNGGGRHADMSAQEMIDLALATVAAITDWERRFVISISGRRKLSEKQLDVLNAIARKCRAYRSK